MRVVKPGWLSRRLAVDQAVRPLGVELHHPVANDLERHPADPGRLRARRAFVNRRQRQKPARLRPVLRSLRRRPHHLRIKISPERNGHGEPPSFTTLNQNSTDSGIPIRVMPSETWYKLRSVSRGPSSKTHTVADVSLQFRHRRHGGPEAVGVGVTDECSASVSECASSFGIDSKTDDVTTVRIVAAVIAFRAVRPHNIVENAIGRCCFRIEFDVSWPQRHRFVVRDISFVADCEMARFRAFVEHRKAKALARFARRTGDAAQGSPRLHARKTEAHPCVQWAALGRDCRRSLGFGARSLFKNETESRRNEQPRHKPDHDETHTASNRALGNA